MIIRRILLLACFGLSATAQDKGATSPLDQCRIVPLELRNAPEKKPFSVNQDTPEQAAMSYLHLLGEEQEIPNTLQIRSPYISHQRKKEIADEIKTISNLLSQSRTSLKGYRNIPRITLVGSEEDGDLASVFFMIHNPDFPLTFTGGTLALVRQDGKWKVGPRSGSFDNTGLPFTGDTRDRAEQLIGSLNNRIADHLNLTKLNKQEDIAKRIGDLRKRNAGKSRKELTGLLADAIRFRDPVSVTALTDSGNKNHRTLQLKFVDVLMDMGMLKDLRKNMGLSYSTSYLKLAADPSNIIVPLPEKTEKPEDEGEPQTIIDDVGRLMEDDSDLPQIGVTIHGAEKKEPSIRSIVRRSQNKKDDKEITTRKLGVIAMNMLPAYGWSVQNKQLPMLAYDMNLKDPDKPDQNPFFIRTYSESFGDIQPIVTRQNELYKLIASHFHDRYPARHWATAEEAARDILNMASKGDVTGLMQSIDPGFMQQDTPDSFIRALEFVRDLAMSAQMPFPDPKTDNNGRSSQVFISQAMYVMTNPFTPLVEQAILYHEPGDGDVIVLADAPESSTTPGLSKIRFKITRNKDGQWILKVYPGTLPLLNHTPSNGFHSLSRFRRGDKNNPTINEDAPLFRACRRHFLDAMQPNAK